MSTSSLRPCFSCKKAGFPQNVGTSSKPVEVLRKTRVSFTPNAPLRQLLTPMDLLPFCFRHYISWPLFFNYDIDFQRLVKALDIVSQKYLLLNGRLCTDDGARYAIEVGSTEGKQYDFPVIEISSDMQMAEAILHHGQMTAHSADFPVHPDKVPFFMEPIDVKTVHKGQDPFLRVKLTHFSDGCCLAVSMSHLLADGMRLSELYRDISRAYCGKEVLMRDINRQYMMYEGFSQHFSPEDKEDSLVPKTMPTGREPLALKQYPNESSSLEILHFPKELITDLKSGVAPFIPNGSFVSTADLMQALIWMLNCELTADCGEITNSTELGIVGTQSIYSVELSTNGLGIIPPNYLGNGFLGPCIHAGSEMGSKSLIELLAALALLTRQKQTDLKKQPKEVFRLLVARCAPFTSTSGNSLVSVSNGCKMEISEANFGQGAPSLFLRPVLLPFTGSGFFVTPVFQTDGILLTMLVTTKRKERLQKSSVLKECAPEVKSLFDDFGVEDLNQLLKYKRC